MIHLIDSFYGSYTELSQEAKRAVPVGDLDALSAKQLGMGYAAILIQLTFCLVNGISLVIRFRQVIRDALKRIKGAELDVFTEQ